LLADGQVTEASRAMREATGAGLNDAKDAVDEMRRFAAPMR
jgi:ribosomal protein L7/L12